MGKHCIYPFIKKVEFVVNKNNTCLNFTATAAKVYKSYQIRVKIEKGKIGTTFEETDPQ